MPCCIICYKNCNSPAQIYSETKADVKSYIKSFLSILERYINGGKDEAGSSTRFPNEMDKVIEGGIVSCQNCYNLLEDFRDIYYVMEEAEMILNWKMKCLVGIIESGDLESGVEEPAKDVMDWRRMIATKCNKKIQSSFPKLILKRSFLGVNCPEMPPKRKDNNDNLMEHMGAWTEPPLNLQNTGDEKNRQNKTTGEESPQTTDMNEDTPTPTFTANDDKIVSKDASSDASSIFRPIFNRKHHPSQVPSNTTTICNPFKITSFVKYPPNYKKDGKRWKCDKEKCHFATNNHTDYSIHQLRHDKIKNVSCKICNMKFIQQSTLNRHVRETHHKIKLFKCIFCAKPFRRASHTKKT